MIKERGVKMEGRKYYAHSCLWGVNAVRCHNVGKYWGEYYAFSSKAARDAWVDENYLSRDKASVDRGRFPARQKLHPAGRL